MIRQLLLLLVPFAKATFSVFDSECTFDTSRHTILNISDVLYVADDELGGRTENTEESILAQEYLIDQMLEMGAVGLDSSKAGRDAFRVDVNNGQGTNIMGLLEGDTDEYIYLSAHYDHLTECYSYPESDSTVCNGAMDNAASVAIVLGVGRFLVNNSEKRRHNIVFAFWDVEEDGPLDVSNYYVNSKPLVPLDKTTFLNWDIQGANLAPSLRDSTLAIGAETGGARLKRAVKRAIQSAGTNLDVKRLSKIFGEGESDHTSFTNKNVPAVFFTDATNACYHSDGDEIKNLDFGKLEKQAKIAAALVYDVSCLERTPRYHRLARFRLATYRDALQMYRMFDALVENDLEYWWEDSQVQLKKTRNTLRRIRRRGPVLFYLSIPSFLVSVLRSVQVLPNGECHGFLA